jgi:hypothetical protein
MTESSTLFLCKYSNIFGKPREGAHSIRIFDIAVVDTVATVFLAWGLSRYYKYNFYKTLLFLFILGIILHRLFCVNTKINTIIFGQV